MVRAFSTLPGGVAGSRCCSRRTNSCDKRARAAPRISTNRQGFRPPWSGARSAASIAASICCCDGPGSRNSSAGTERRDSSASRVFEASACIEEPQYLGRLVLHQRRIATRFNVQSYQRLGVRTSKIEAPAVEFHRQAVGKVDRPGARLVVLLYTREHCPGICQPLAEFAIDLAAGRIQLLPLADQFRQALAR